MKLRTPLIALAVAIILQAALTVYIGINYALKRNTKQEKAK